MTSEAYRQVDSGAGRRGKDRVHLSALIRMTAIDRINKTMQVEKHNTKVYSKKEKK